MPSADVTIERRAVKNARLRVRESGAVDLIVPERFTDAQVGGILTRKAEWIAEKQRYFAKRVPVNHRLRPNEMRLLGDVFTFVSAPKLRFRTELDHRGRLIRTGVNLAVEGVVAFAQSVDSPWQVGLSLGVVADQSADAALLPAYLVTESKKLEQLSAGFVWGRFRSKGWEWVDNTDARNWSNIERGTFLTRLPFCRETWLRVERLLGADSAAYWKTTSANPYEAEEGDLAGAAEQLLQFGRARAAIQCVERLTHGKEAGPVELVIRVLQANLTSDESVGGFDQHATLELIKWLQKHPDTASDKLFQIEWSYLPLLGRYGGGSPKTLMRRLAHDPAFFCEVIRTVFRSKNEDEDENADDDEDEPSTKRKWTAKTAYRKFIGFLGKVLRSVFGSTGKHVVKEVPLEEKKRIAENAYRLLSEWQLPPGCDEQRRFDETVFRAWVDEVKRLLTRRKKR